LAAGLLAPASALDLASILNVWPSEQSVRPLPEIDEVLCQATNWTIGRTLSHSVGTQIKLATPLIVGPGSGAPAATSNSWTIQVESSPLPDTKFLMLHFTGVSLPGRNMLEVNLGYDIDIFHASDGPTFWSRPIDTKALRGRPIEVTYVIDRATTGEARIDVLGVSQRLPGWFNAHVLSNCDPFFTDARYTEPIYDPHWFCDGPPHWSNMACIADSNDVRVRVAKSVGMMLGPAEAPNGGDVLSTCSVT